MNSYKRNSVISGMISALIMNVVYWGTIIFLTQNKQTEIVCFPVALIAYGLLYVIVREVVKRKTNAQLRMWAIILGIASALFSSISALLVQRNFTEDILTYFVFHLMICFLILCIQLVYGGKNDGGSKKISFGVALLSNAFFWFTIVSSIYMDITGDELWIYYINLPILLVIYVCAYKKEQFSLRRFFLWDLVLGIFSNYVYICYDADNIFALFWGILEGMIILRIFLISCILRLRTKPDDEKWYKVCLVCCVVVLCGLVISDGALLIDLLTDFE